MLVESVQETRRLDAPGAGEGEAVKRARIVWLVLLALALVYEAYAILNSIPSDTLSEAVWDAHHPMITFAAGVITGHFFWQRKAP